MPEDVRVKFLNVFAHLKQRVLWKWETEEMAGLPPNVKLAKWVPQQDVVGHANTKLFISHGGLCSTQEATFHGVPIVGIPIFADQDLNIRQAERAGYARAVEILEMTEETLEDAINGVLNNKQYAEQARELSAVYRDQPQTPLDRAVFWTEYVMRHNGARHMRSAARNLNFFQYYCLDVIAVLLELLAVILWVCKIILGRILGLFRRRKAASVKHAKKAN